MSPDVLRRKLQKKAKQRPRGKCPACGERTERVLLFEDVPGRRGPAAPGRWRLFRACRGRHFYTCFWLRELFRDGQVSELADEYRGPQGPPGKA